MKRLIYSMTLLLAFAFVSTSLAEIPGSISHKIKIDNPFVLKYNGIPVADPNHKGTTEIQETRLKIDTITEYFSSIWTHMANVSPFVYDPVSGIMMIVGCDRNVANNAITNFPVYLNYSTNGGTSWAGVNLFDEQGFGGLLPSIAVHNYNDAASIGALPFTVVGRLAENSGGEWPWNGDLVLFPNKEGGNIEFVQVVNPEENNPSFGQMWGSMKLHPLIIDTDALVFGAGTLSPLDGFQYGSYGFFGWHFNQEDVFASEIPTSWSLNQFRQSQSTQNSFQGPIELGLDNREALYAGVINFFFDDQENRTPGFSKLDAIGSSWGEFVKMPHSIAMSYAQSFGYDNLYQLNPYAMFEFIVYGPDNVGFIFPAGLALGQQFEEVHLVEAYYKNGSWGIRKIADMNSFTPLSLIVSSAFSTSEDWVYEVIDNPIGHEIQAAITADGQNIIIKWIDLNEDATYTINPPHRVTTTNNDNEEVETTISEVIWSDVFMVYKGINEDNWSEPKNVTNDINENYRSTWMTDVVPSINKVPLIHHRTPDVTNTMHPTYGTPRALEKMIIDLFPYVMYSEIDVTGIINSQEEENYSFNLGDAYPNPAENVTEIPFTLDEPGYVKIELFDAMGRKVMDLFENYLGTGFQGINVNTSELSTGSYYYTMTVNGQRLTKALKVVK